MSKAVKRRHQATGFITPDGLEIVEAGHTRHRVGECDWCDFKRAESIGREFIWRLENCGIPVHNLNMWSLGSSLRDTHANRKKMRGHWAKFRNHFHKRGGFPVVFRVLEVGRHGYLHFHFVAIAFMEHAVVLALWRGLTGEASNVHVSGQNGAQEPRRLVKYLCKYLTKETTAYRWCGPFYGLHRDRQRSISGTGGRPGRMPGSFGEMYYGFTTEQHKKEKRDAQARLPEASGGGEIE